MSYTPKTEEQLIREGLMPDGVYDCEAVETSDKQSSKGGDMITLKLHVFDEESNPRIIFDYIALGNNFGERKFRHAADSFGLLDIYSAGTLAHSDFQNKFGKVTIKTQNGTPEYPNPKNVVSDYVKREGEQLTPQAAAIKAVAAIEDDGVPF